MIERGSMREAINSVYQILRNDEELLRLLWYKPYQLTDVEPLDVSLDNISNVDEDNIWYKKYGKLTDNWDEDKYWQIVNDRILLQEKVSDLEGNALCRLYLSSGRRRSNTDNYYLANQEIVVNLFVHEDYQSDMRAEWIADRLHELLSLEKTNGVMGRLVFVKSDPWEAPSQYQRFVHTYRYITGVK